jgi:hypothetical protein
LKNQNFVMLMFQGIGDAETHLSPFAMLFYLVKPALAGFACQRFQSYRFRVAQSISTVSIFNQWGSI